MPSVFFDEETLRRWYIEEKKSIPEIARLCGAGNTTVLYWLKKLGIPRRTFIESASVSSFHTKNRTGENSPAWRGGIRRKRHDKKVYLGRDSDIAWGNGELRESTFIIEQRLGRRLLPGEVTHHLDEDETNNSPDNLIVLTRSQHAALHAALRKARQGASVGGVVDAEG